MGVILSIAVTSIASASIPDFFNTRTMPSCKGGNAIYRNAQDFIKFHSFIQNPNRTKFAVPDTIYDSKQPTAQKRTLYDEVAHYKSNVFPEMWGRIQYYGEQVIRPGISKNLKSFPEQDKNNIKIQWKDFQNKVNSILTIKDKLDDSNCSIQNDINGIVATCDQIIDDSFPSLRNAVKDAVERQHGKNKKRFKANKSEADWYNFHAMSRIKKHIDPTYNTVIGFLRNMRDNTLELQKRCNQPGIPLLGFNSARVWKHPSPIAKTMYSFISQQNQNNDNELRKSRLQRIAAGLATVGAFAGYGMYALFSK